MSVLLSPAVHWKILDSKEVFRTPFFSLRTEKCELPDKRIMSDYYIFNCQDWVQIVPLTTENKFVMVSQYRHAAREQFFEFPGGVMDKEESPEQTARRELLEETGFEAGHLSYLGFHYPNPALQENKLHVFSAHDCKKVAGQNLDEFEDIEIQLVDQKDLKPILKKEGQHALMLTSYLMFHLSE